MTLFKPAVKHESKLRLAIAGPSGSGKTYSALAIGTALGKTAVVDTEHGSAAKYADLFPFDTLELDAPFHPDKFTEAIKAAADAGYNVLIIDSLSHAWNGPGGVLELKEQFARQKGFNDYTAWGPAGEIQNRLIQTMLGADIHIIATMRSKMDYAVEEYEENGRRKTRIRKVGMAPVQRNDTEYEFDILLDMDIDNYATVSKTRCSALTGQVIKKPGKELANTLREWLSGAPAPTHDDILADLASAKTLQAWSSTAYKLPEVHNAFESAQRVADWYGFAVGDFNAAHNGKVTDALKKYTDAKADGVGSREAAEASRKAFTDSVAKAQKPLFEEEGPSIEDGEIDAVWPAGRTS